jgi:hypothetical protein
MTFFRVLYGSRAALREKSMCASVVTTTPTLRAVKSGA